MKLNRSIDEAIAFIKANWKRFGGTMNLEQIGKELNVKGPRVSQLWGQFGDERYPEGSN